MATATLEPEVQTEVQSKFQMLPLAHITPSPMNPRKRFDEKALKELADSIKAHGVQQPIVVRPDGNKKDRYEIVVGERRFKASKLAGKTEIPALINTLSNAAALEIMVIENLQRENVHPLEEALGYEALMRKPSETDAELGELPGAPRHTAESIAAKVGKSVGYVYARLKLLALVPASREAFEQDHITAGHAVLIARLQPADQLKALAACFKNYVTQFEEQAIKKLEPMVATWFAVCEAVNLPTADETPENDDYFAGTSEALRLASEKYLREWIQEHINLKLKGVPWDLDDDKLVAGAGACALCPKRSMSNPSLFAELTKKGEDDTCFDPGCFQAKQKAFVKLQVKSAKTSEAPLVQISEQTAYTKPKEGEKVLKQGQWLPAKKGECEGVTEALIVRGENAGEYQTVCADLSCKVHKRHLSSSSSRATDFNPEQSKRDEEADKREVEKARKFKLLLFEKVRSKFDGASRQILQLIANKYFNEQGVWDHKGLVEYRGWKGAPEKVLREKIEKLPLDTAWGLMAEIILWGDVEDRYEELGHHLPDIAKGYKLDVKKLSAEFEKVQTPAKPEQSAKPAKPAKKAKAKGKAAGK